MNTAAQAPQPDEITHTALAVSICHLAELAERTRAELDVAHGDRVFLTGRILELERRVHELEQSVYSKVHLKQ